MCDRENAYPTCTPSEFTQKQFEAAGLGDVAARVSQGDPLDLADAERLAKASLPFLAKLVRLRPHDEPCDSPAVDPVVHLLLTEWLSSEDREAAISKATSAIREAASQLASLIDLDERVRDFGDCVRTLHVVIDASEDCARNDFQSAIERLFQEAEQPDISVSLTHSSSDILPTLSESQAASTMRDIALFRLASPDHGEVRAPVGRLGIKTAHVALSFGANHLGQVAVDVATAAALNIPTLTELADALRYDTPTPV